MGATEHQGVGGLPRRCADDPGRRPGHRACLRHAAHRHTPFCRRGLGRGQRAACPALPEPEDFAPEVIALTTELPPTWRLDIVPARDPEGAALGYSAVCVGAGSGCRVSPERDHAY